MRRSVLTILLALTLTLPARASLIDRPHLSVSATLIDPGASTTIWTGFYSDQPEKHLAELRGPPGWSIATPEQDVFTDGTRGRIVEWRVTAGKGVRWGRYPFTLLVDGVEVDSISVDVRLVGVLVWLPWVRR